MSTKASPSAEFWVCDRCKSLNQRWAKRCYGCQAERPVDHQIFSSDGPSAVWRAAPGVGGAPGPSGSITIARYRPSTIRAAFAVTFIGLATLLGLGLLLISLTALARGGRHAWTDDLAPFFAAGNEGARLAWVGLLLGTYLGAAISWLAWLSRAVDNVSALGGGRPSTSPRGAITSWFVPVVNLAKPYWILRDVHDRLAVAGRRNAPLRAWWICWLPTGLNLTIIGAVLVFWLLELGLVAIPVLLFPFYAIDPLVGIVATVAFAWLLAGFLVRGRGMRIVALAGLVVAATTFLGLVLAVALERALEHGSSLADISATVQQFSTAFSLVGSIAWILAGFLSIWIVIEIERRQRARARLGAVTAGSAAAG
jgi:Domain of unknown function (DUF4328)